MESTLKPILERFLTVNKRLAEANAKAKELREQRQSVELDLAAAYNEARIRNLALPNKVELKTSQMVFAVKQPGEWKKGWTLSKKQLEQYLMEILPEHGEDVMREIVARHDRTLVANDYSFDLKPLDIT